MTIDYRRFTDHELAVAVEVMDMNWHDVMAGKNAGHKCFRCGALTPDAAPRFVTDYVFERSRAREEQQRRLHGPSAGRYING